MSNHVHIDRFKKLGERETMTRFLEIYASAHPDNGDFVAEYGDDISRWMETYSRVKVHEQAEILDAVAMAFGACVSAKNKQIRGLEEKVVVLKAEVTRLQNPNHPSKVKFTPIICPRCNAEMQSCACPDAVPPPVETGTHTADHSRRAEMPEELYKTADGSPVDARIEITPGRVTLTIGDMGWAWNRQASPEPRPAPLEEK